MKLCCPKTSLLLKTRQLNLQTNIYNGTSSTRSGQQVRHASLIRRPYRPYTFTQLIVLSDGSTFTMRTTSPAPVYKSNKDSRNHPLWQPSSSELRNVEADEAGRLRAFRQRFGTGWDAEEKASEDKKESSDQKIRIRSSKSSGITRQNTGKDQPMQPQSAENTVATSSLMDMISNAATGSSNYTIAGGKTDKQPIEKDPGEKLVTTKNALGKSVQVKVKDLEQFRKDQKSAKSKST